MYTQYKFSAQQITQAAVAVAAEVVRSKPGVNPAKFAADTVAARLRKKPESHLQYGMYWWAVKAALFELGHDFGTMDDAGIRIEYGGQGLHAYGALIAGEQFRDYYLKTFLSGTAQFLLDDQGEESYVLFDPDMEARRLGAGALLVSANIGSIQSVDDPVLDSVLDGEQVFTQFKHNCKGAIEALRKAGGGVALAAITHHEIGDIDLRWGRDIGFKGSSSGLLKIIRWHPEVLDDLQGFVDRLEVVQKTSGRIRLKDPRGGGAGAAVSLDYYGKTGHWLLTAYEKPQKQDGGAHVAGSTMDAASLTAGNDTATPGGMSGLILGFLGEEVNAAALDSVAGGDATEPECPFAFNFKHGGVDWTATFYGSSDKSAKHRLNTMIADGRMDSAARMAKSVGEPFLENSDYNDPLLVDFAAKTVIQMGKMESSCSAQV